MSTSETNNNIQGDAVALTREELDGIAGGEQRGRQGEKQYCGKCKAYKSVKYVYGTDKRVCEDCGTEFK